ncbi:hypothetical protein GCM10028808_05430 [Spirosoma migulaei]
MKNALILLAIIFIPFIWFIYKMIRYTDDTIGENSPLYRERTYEIQIEQYFVTFYKLLLVFTVVMMLILTKMLISIALNQHDPLVFMAALLFLGFAVYVLFVFYVDWHYWTITRNVQLTLNPFQPSIHIDSPDQLATLTPDSIDRIELHLRKSDNPKEPLYGYGYYLFYQKDGTAVRINNIFFTHYAEFLERFFSHTPRQIIRHRIPWITPIE